MMGIFDSHSHYTDSAFDPDRKELLTELHEKQGVSAIMLAGTDVDDSYAALELSKEFDFIFSSAGIHPEFAGKYPHNYLYELEKIAGSAKVKAIGEIGLDYHYSGYDEKKQKILFEEQLELAQSLGLPVIIHSRDATADMLEIVKRRKPSGVVHCFSGSAETARELVSLGLYIGFTGVVTFKNAKKSRLALEAVPENRLLVETDCPYMAPEPWRSKRCHSGMLTSVIEKIAEVKATTYENVLHSTAENACELYKIEI